MFLKLSRSFLSLYILITFTFIFTAWLLDEVWRSYLEQDIESYTGYKTMLIAIGDYVKKHPEEEWPSIVEGMGNKYNLPLTLEAIDTVNEEHRSEYKLLEDENTHVFYQDENVVLHHLVEGSINRIVLGPTKMPTRPRVEALMRVFLLLILALMILVWMRPISRDLDKLRNATREFGKGKFDVVAPAAKSTMLFPLVHAFNLMASRIKNLVEANKELTNAVSHELRTPLARSKFALQMLSTAKSDEKREQYIKQIHSDIYELEEMINELLVYASLESDKPQLNLDKISLKGLVAEQKQQHPDALDRLVINSSTKDIIVECDKHLITRALNNYVTNAIKYGGDKVEVSIGIEKKYAVIRVDDSGSGVSDDLKTTIFDAFSRGDQSRNRETGGYGLGLAIVKRIMDWHQGVACVEDSKLGGAAFILKWPLVLSK